MKNRFRTRIGVLLTFATALTLAACESAPPEQEADRVLRNGKVVTVDAEHGEAQAVAISGDRILAVGSDEEIDAYIGESTDVIDLEGRLAIPGFVESHGHFMSLGESKLNLDLTEADTWQDIVDMVADAAANAEPGTLIEGRGWHQEKWSAPPPGAVQGNPVHAGLSAVSPNNPVRLGHASGHASFVNQAMMDAAGIDASTADPAGGEIVRDADGDPTGLLRETAQRLTAEAEAEAVDLTPEEELARMREMVRLAGEEALSHGVTSFHDAGAPFTTIDFLRDMADQGALPIRLYVMVRGESNEDMDRLLSDYRMIGYGGEFLTVRSIKRQIDGALGSHGAWLLSPYTDMESSVGLVLETVEDITGTAEVAIRHGYQVNTHAIGDRANREVLDIYQQAFAANPDQADLRWRIEHAQHVDPADLPRFSELGVIAAMQGIHTVSDAPWIPIRLGNQRAAEGAYMFRSLIDSGVTVTNGTDVPVESIDPIAVFYGSVARRDLEGNAFYPAQAMTRMEALESYTINGAYAAFEEEIKGSITPGKLADIVVLSQDILTVPEEQIPQTEIVMTLLGGEVRFRR